MYTALITGSSRGIGLELTTQYAKAGWRVFATCRNPQIAKALQRVQRRFPENVVVEALDVEDHTQIEKLGKRLKKESIDLLINNAGWCPIHMSLAEVKYPTLEQSMRVNAYATLKMAQVFLEHVARSQKKTIATISSRMGSISENKTGKRYAYRVSKAAANMVVKTLAVDLFPRKITVVSLNPGWVKTALGGTEALISKAESVTGLREVIERLTLDDTGRFYSYTGEEIPW